MLLQTNSYIVPKDRRSEHARLLRKFRQTLHRLGCDHFEVYEQVGSNWAGGEATGRFVQIMRFRDRKHQQQVQAAEKQDAAAQQFIGEFCALINFPYQQQQGLFAVGFYTSALAVRSGRKLISVAPIPELGPALADEPTAGVPADAGGVGTGAAAAVAAEALAADEPAAPEPLPLEVPVPGPVPSAGTSLLDFAALDPDALSHASPATEVGPEVPLVESEIPAAQDDPPFAEFHEPNAVTPAEEGAAAPASDAPEELPALVPDDAADGGGATPDDEHDSAFADMLAELTFDDPDAPADPPRDEARDEADARPRAR